MKKKIFALVLVATMTAFTACGNKENNSAETKIEETQVPTALPETEETTEPTTTVSTDELENVGSVDNLTYTNNAIGFTLTAPEGWVMKGSQDTYEYVVSTGMAADVETLKSMLKNRALTICAMGQSPQQISNKCLITLLFKQWQGLCIVVWI